MPAPAASALAARGRLASRVRYLTANNPLAASAALGWQTGLVGSGIVAQSVHPTRPCPPQRCRAGSGSLIKAAHTPR